jgi:hypothetical protein
MRYVSTRVSLLEQHEERQASDSDQHEGKNDSWKSSTLVPHGQKEPIGTDDVIDAETVDAIEVLLVSSTPASWNQIRNLAECPRSAPRCRRVMNARAERYIAPVIARSRRSHPPVSVERL